MSADDMHDEHDLGFAKRISGPLRHRDTADPAFVERVMSGVRLAADEMRAEANRGWWRRPRTVSITPLAALALAAGVVLAFIAVRRTDTAGTAATTVAARVDTVHVVRFVFSGDAARGARGVMLVGSFNDWNKSAVPMARHESGAWSVSLPLAIGQHEYAFVVIDAGGERWVADPAALRIRDEFGAETSVLSIGST